jgi:hypothetical protein
MTSTPVTLLLKRSGNASDRPSGNILVNGELATNFGAADPGVYFENSAGGIVKIGPSSFGNTAPNAVPVGLAGNSVGEQWVDTNSAAYYLKVWTGSTWQKIYSGFADSATVAGQANSSSIASGALTANTATLASGAILASGVVTAAGTPSVLVLLSGIPSPASYASGTLVYQIQSSGTTPSGLFIRVLNGWAFT